jgi:hypothetical protein
MHQGSSRRCSFPTPTKYHIPDQVPNGILLPLNEAQSQVSAVLREKKKRRGREMFALSEQLCATYHLISEWRLNDEHKGKRQK